MTIKDIARESGYAVGTVSRVLNNHPDVSDTARERIMEVVEKYHFRLNNNAKHLKQQASNGIAIIVNPENSVENLSMDDISKIYTGEITNWKELGAEDAPIVPIGREAASGTRDGLNQ